MRADDARTIKAHLRAAHDQSSYLFPSRKGLPIGRVHLHGLMKYYGGLAKLPEDKRHFQPCSTIKGKQNYLHQGTSSNKKDR
jgi:hypothetical protein